MELKVLLCALGIFAIIGGVIFGIATTELWQRLIGFGIALVGLFGVLFLKQTDRQQ